MESWHLLHCRLSLLGGYGVALLFYCNNHVTRNKVLIIHLFFSYSRLCVPLHREIRFRYVLFISIIVNISKFFSLPAMRSDTCGGFLYQ